MAPSSVFFPLVLLLLLVGPGCGEDLSSDTQALLHFYHSIAVGRRTLNWFGNASVCLWVGVGCSPQEEKRRVWYLRLPASGLYGHIPPDSLGALTQLRVLSLRSNRLSGPLPPDLSSNCPQLRDVFLLGNSFSGDLPAFEGSPRISKIDLSFNNFSGHVPPSYTALPRLVALLLQNNSLSGSLADLSSLRTLQQLNVSNNHLNGSIPVNLQQFPITAFTGNYLCGKPLANRDCPFTRSPPPPLPTVPSTPSTFQPKFGPGISKPEESPQAGRLSIGPIAAIAVGTAAFVFFCIAGVVVLYSKKRVRSLGQGNVEKKTKGSSHDEYSSSQERLEARGKKLVFFPGSHYSFDLEDLLRASAEVLGKGNAGTSYKAVLEDGSAVVVKRLKDVAIGRKEFEQQMGRVGNLHHTNLLPLRAYYFSKEEKLLLFDYVPMGSLSALLHGGRGGLDWESRAKIAVGTATALAYLHQSGGSEEEVAIIHGNIKSSNVLVDRNLNAHLAEYGLAPLFAPVSSGAGMLGYRAPEVAATRKATPSSDVYAFGVLLLELLTGKPPTATTTTTNEDLDLPRWVQSVVREEWTAEVFDTELVTNNNNDGGEEQMVQMLQVAMGCVTSVPDQRPSMAHVLQMLQDIRHSDSDKCKTEEESSHSGAEKTSPTN